MSSGNVPTLINLPPPPSDPVTPSEVPSRSGTPNSTTTSMSELSTVAIKDGHRGHMAHHPHHPSSGLSHQLDAERADRISRLAGLERVATARNPSLASAPGNTTLAPGYPGPGGGPGLGAGPPSVAPYFDAAGNPTLGRERSTVGSASATGSVGARTTWAGSEAGEGDTTFDRMSESAGDMDLDTSSVGGLSEEGTASLVGFGEGARTPARQSVGGPAAAQAANANIALGAKPAPLPAHARETSARMLDGVTYDPDVVDTTAADPRRATASPTGATEQAERIVRENMNTTSADRMRRGQGPKDLGKFGFE